MDTLRPLFARHGYSLLALLVFMEAVGVPDPLIAFASFATASVEMEQRMAQLRPVESADLAAQVYYATLLDIEGFTFDARAEWRRLARMFPDERAIQRRAQ